MGRIVVHPAFGMRRPSPPSNEDEPWDVSLVILGGVMRTTHGVARCQGRITLHFCPNGGWELAFRDGESGLREAVGGDEDTPAREAMERFFLGMFRVGPNERAEMLIGVTTAVLMTLC